MNLVKYRDRILQFQSHNKQTTCNYLIMQCQHLMVLTVILYQIHVSYAIHVTCVLIAGLEHNIYVDALEFGHFLCYCDNHSWVAELHVCLRDLEYRTVYVLSL